MFGLQAVEQSINESSKWKVFLVILTEILCYGMTNSRIKEIHIKTISNERTVRFVQLFQHAERYPPEQRKMTHKV